MGLFNECFTQLCKIPTDIFYCACAILASELGKLQEPVICRKSDQIIPLWIWTFIRKGLPFWFQTELILHHLGHSEQQLISIWIWISLQLLTHLWIKILGTLDLESYEGYCNLLHNDIPVESLFVGSFADLLLEVYCCKCWDLYLYEFFELMVLFFEPTMVFGLMCQN